MLAESKSLCDKLIESIAHIIEKRDGPHKKEELKQLVNITNLKKLIDSHKAIHIADSNSEAFMKLVLLEMKVNLMLDFYLYDPIYVNTYLLIVFAETELTKKSLGCFVGGNGRKEDLKDVEEAIEIFKALLGYTKEIDSDMERNKNLEQTIERIPFIITTQKIPYKKKMKYVVEYCDRIWLNL